MAGESENMYGKILNENGIAKRWDDKIPVPLHPLKQSRRDYNQREHVGLGLCEALSETLENGLHRRKFTQTQTQTSGLERMNNRDNVMTTGATLCACATVLLVNGTNNVDLVTIPAGG